MRRSIPRSWLTLILLLVGAQVACSSSTFKDPGLERLTKTSRELSNAIVKQRDAIDHTFKSTNRYINAVPMNLAQEDNPLVTSPNDLHRLRTILLTCFNQPVQAEVSTCTVEPLTLYLSQHNLSPNVAKAMDQRVERIMQIQHDLKVELPENIFALSEMLINANKQIRLLNSKIETLNPEEHNLNDSGVLDLDNARLGAESARDQLKLALRTASPQLDALNEELDKALERMVYSLISFGLPVTPMPTEDDPKDP